MLEFFTGMVQKNQLKLYSWDFPQPRRRLMVEVSNVEEKDVPVNWQLYILIHGDYSL